MTDSQEKVINELLQKVDGLVGRIAVLEVDRQRYTNDILFLREEITSIRGETFVPEGQKGMILHGPDTVKLGK